MAVAIGCGLIGLDTTPSGATFTAQTGGSQLSVTTTWVGAPSLSAPSMAGLTASMTGSGGTNATGWQVAGVPTTATDCSAVSYSSYTPATGTTYTQSFASADNGKLACFKAQSTLGGWTNVTGSPTSSIRVGLVTKTVSYAPAASGCTVAATCGATITLTFNQPVSPTSVAALAGEPVCFLAPTGGVSGIFIADTSTSGCSKSDSYDVGFINGVTPASTSRAAATYALSNNNQTLTVQITALTGAPTVTGFPAPFQPSGSKLQSTTGSVPLCSSTGTNKTPDCTVSATTG